MKATTATNQLSDDELLAELGVSADPPKTGGRTPREERIIAGFEDIQRFFEANGRVPQHGEELDARGASPARWARLIRTARGA